MCKNARTPCPGCKKHKAAAAKWMFFTDEERRAAEGVRQLAAPRKSAPALPQSAAR